MYVPLPTLANHSGVIFQVSMFWYASSLHFFASFYISVLGRKRSVGEMGRPPCCDKEGVKKGPWTPEEDIMLVSYIQEHGAGNWRAVPSKTGLRRCSKSCRLRWTNYLRPGIKRGSFTEDEEKMIIQLQALLGNKWAAIASYLPERTDNDIKNYWNTHLRKKLKKLQESPLCHSSIGFSSSHSISRGQWEKKLQTDINKAKQALNDALSLDKPKLIIPELKPSNGYFSYSKTTQGSTYASSTENIARLLKGWVKKTPKLEQANSSSVNETTSSEGDQSGPKDEGVDLSEAFESIFGFSLLNHQILNFHSLCPLRPVLFKMMKESQMWVFSSRCQCLRIGCLMKVWCTGKKNWLTSHLILTQSCLSRLDSCTEFVIHSIFCCFLSSYFFGSRP
ncbi:hypothetical protein RHMOL_Rhmol10G0049300 [Rhododendron molle]|uniref:Uncharacterized protein n=1 Tax=Rhododendron molle TaxID=49168 RepID=A0ACC0M0J3_RHOML|nr:hypothetical protein RHMOL_Rhmol10G0049300 [Rhododendron molle]